jgi:hypothetical protein
VTHIEDIPDDVVSSLGAVGRSEDLAEMTSRSGPSTSDVPSTTLAPAQTAAGGASVPAPRSTPPPMLTVTPAANEIVTGHADDRTSPVGTMKANESDRNGTVKHLRRCDQARPGWRVPLLKVIRRPVTVRWGGASASRSLYGIVLPLLWCAAVGFVVIAVAFSISGGPHQAVTRPERSNLAGRLA